MPFRRLFKLVEFNNHALHSVFGSSSTSGNIFFELLWCPLMDRNRMFTEKHRQSTSYTVYKLGIGLIRMGKVELFNSHSPDRLLFDHLIEKFVDLMHPCKLIHSCRRFYFQQQNSRIYNSAIWIDQCIPKFSNTWVYSKIHILLSVRSKLLFVQTTTLFAWEFMSRF